MIKIQKTPIPEVLLSGSVRNSYAQMENFYNSSNRSQQRFDFRRHVRRFAKLIKKDLQTKFNGKCGYCEMPIRHHEETKAIRPYDVATIDHYRHYKGIRDNEKYYPDLYWWLVFDWDNLIYACHSCNSYKSTYFPVKDYRASPIEKDIENEIPLLLNPCEDEPDKHLALNEDGTLKGISLRGTQTIELLRLNREDLIYRRKEIMDEILMSIQMVLVQVEDAKERVHVLTEVISRNLNFSSKSPFIFTRRQYFLKVIESLKLSQKNDNQDKIIFEHLKPLQEYKSKIDKIHSEPEEINLEEIEKSDYFPIEWIKIENFKGISSIQIDVHELANETENLEIKTESEKFEAENEESIEDNPTFQADWLVLLGENGLGKSSILQAICLGLKPFLENGDKEISSFIKHGEEVATITIKEKDKDNIVQTILKRESNQIEHKGDFSSALIGYGSVRLLPNQLLKPKVNQHKNVRYDNLFSPYEPLNPIFEWLNDIFHNDKDLFDTIAISLKEILPRNENDDLTIVNGKLYFVQSGKSFDSLSDGYQSTILLALDIMCSLSLGNIPMNELTGVVLIDELGNQLHPRWQMEVVQQFRKVFPKVTFIVSTHHPLCLRGLKDGEVVVLRKDVNDGEIFSIKDLPSFSHLRVDQILTSPYFGLHSAMDKSSQDDFENYYNLLAKTSLTEEEELQKNQLKAKLKDVKYLGDTLREELALHVIDELIAKKLNDRNADIGKNLKAEVKNKIKTIWATLNKIDK